MAIIEVTGDNFENDVLKANQTVLVDFNAQWCGPCKMLKPILQELSDEKSDVKFVSIDIDDELELADEYEVSSIPCLVVFKDGKEVDRSVGLIQKDAINALLEG